MIQGQTKLHKRPQTAPGSREGKRSRILKSAWDAFVENGYAATSMADILARVGGSRATLYAYFPSKEELFAAALEDGILSLAARVILPAPTSETLENSLRETCRMVATGIAEPSFQALVRLAIGEAVHFPEIGRVYRTRLIEPLIHRIACFLSDCMAQGLIRQTDVRRATMQLLSLCRGESFIQALIDPVQPPPRDKLIADADAAAATFLAAFRNPDNSREADATHHP